MSGEGIPTLSDETPGIEHPRPPHPWGFFLRWGVRLENGIVIFTLAMMVLLPLLEMVLRHTPLKGFSGSSDFIQHGSLIVGLIGAAIAARENRLLSLATASVMPKGWPRTVAHIIGCAVGGAVGFFLCLESTQFVISEREFSTAIAYGIQKWVLELVLPIGFGLITLGVLYHSAEKWNKKWIAPLVAAILVAACVWTPIEPAKLVVPAFVLLFIATILGAPIFVILGGSALILFWGDGTPISSLSIDHYSLVTNPSLPTIPLFTLAGYFLAEGGASKRLVRVFSALFGKIPGGPAIVTALLCAFFTSFTGASGVTILALGGVLLPILLAAKYSDRAALGLLTGAGSLGMLFPPCLPMVLYAIIAKQEIKQIFLGALIPGFLLVVMTAILGIWMGRKSHISPSPGTPGEGRGGGEPIANRNSKIENPNSPHLNPPPAYQGRGIEKDRFDAREIGASLWEAKWELLIPVVAMVSLFWGFATPVEASAITAFYAFLTQTVIWRDLSFRKGVPHVLVECGLVIGGVLLILGVAQGFTNYLIFAQIPDHAITWLTASVKSKYVFLLLLNMFLLVVGGLMDVYPAIIVVVPLIVPIGLAFGVDPIHLGVIFLANLEMGFLMPPLGMNLLLASYRFRKPMPELYRAILPILAVQFIGVLLITYVPALTTWLPSVFGH